MKIFKFLWAVFLLMVLMPVQAQDERGADDVWPEWSPDGTQIAFVSNRDGYKEIYVMNADGSDLHPVAASSYSSPGVWSPDGQSLTYLVMNTDGNEDIYQVDVDGGESPVNLTNHPLDYGSPRWSPDGAWLAFSTKVGREKSYLFLLGKDSGLPQQIGDIESDYWTYQWSPDGRYLVAWGAIYMSANVLSAYLYDVQTQTVIDLLADYPTDTNSCCWINYDWSLDGHSMYMALPHYPNIYRFDITHRVWSRAVITQNWITTFNLVDDGQQIIYGTERWIDSSQTEGTGVYRFNLADKTTTTLVEAPFSYFVLSSDEAKMLMFQGRQPPENLARMMTVDVESGRQVFFNLPIFNGFGDTWSPVEQQIVASICAGGDPNMDADIYVLDAASGDVTNLTGDDAFSDNPPKYSECSFFG